MEPTSHEGPQRPTREAPEPDYRVTLRQPAHLPRLDSHRARAHRRWRRRRPRAGLRSPGCATPSAWRSPQAAPPSSLLHTSVAAAFAGRLTEDRTPAGEVRIQRAGQDVGQPERQPAERTVSATALPHRYAAGLFGQLPAGQKLRRRPALVRTAVLGWSRQSRRPDRADLRYRLSSAVASARSFGVARRARGPRAAVSTRPPACGDSTALAARLIVAHGQWLDAGVVCDSGVDPCSMSSTRWPRCNCWTITAATSLPGTTPPGSPLVCAVVTERLTVAANASTISVQHRMRCHRVCDPSTACVGRRRVVILTSQVSRTNAEQTLRAGPEVGRRTATILCSRRGWRPSPTVWRTHRGRRRNKAAPIAQAHCSVIAGEESAAAFESEQVVPGTLLRIQPGPVEIRRASRGAHIQLASSRPTAQVTSRRSTSRPEGRVWVSQPVAQLPGSRCAAAAASSASRRGQPAAGFRPRLRWLIH